MRRVLATLTDATAVGLLGYATFRLVDWATPCPSRADCFPLTPLVVIALLLVLTLYFVASVRVLGGTLGQRIFRAPDVGSDRLEKPGPPAGF